MIFAKAGVDLGKGGVAEDLNRLCKLLQLHRCSVLVMEGGGGGKLTAANVSASSRLCEMSSRMRSIMGEVCLSKPLPETSLIVSRFKPLDELKGDQAADAVT